jgi:hypothetical protein
MSRVYVHDDRLGPYTRAQWLRAGDGDGEHKYLWLRIDPYERGFEKFAPRARVKQAIVPLYPKLRLTAEDLVGFAGELLPLVRGIAAEHRDDIRVDLRFALSGTYLRELYSEGLGGARTRRIATRVDLSRYVAIVEFSAGDSRILQAVFDTTDIRREDESMPVLLLVARDPLFTKAMTEAVRAIYPGALVG